MKQRQHTPAPGQKVLIYSADGKTLRGELTVKEVIGNEVYFLDPLTWVQVGDQMWWFDNKRTANDVSALSPPQAART